MTSLLQKPLENARKCTNVCIPLPSPTDRGLAISFASKYPRRGRGPPHTPVVRLADHVLAGPHSAQEIHCLNNFIGEQSAELGITVVTRYRAFGPRVVAQRLQQMQEIAGTGHSQVRQPSIQ